MKTKCKLTISEYLSKDILEEGFMKQFALFRQIQMLMGSCRVDARHRFVSVPTFNQKCYTIICSIVMLTISVVAILKYLDTFYRNTTIYDIFLFALAIHVWTYLSNIMHARFLNNNANVKLYIKMQKIDRLMKIEHNKIITSMIQKINNGTVALLLIVGSLLIPCSATGGSVMAFAFLGITGCHSVFTMEMSHCSNLVLYFYIRLRFVNSIIANHINPVKTEEKSENQLLDCFPHKSLMRRLAAQSHTFSASKTDIYLKEIFGGFYILQEIYRFQILLFFFDYAVFVLLCFELGVNSVQDNYTSLTEWVVAAAMLVISSFQGALVCLTCEAFFSEVKETKRLSVTIMSLHFDGPLRKKAKYMVRMIEETPPSFSVYDMWLLDAHVMLKVFDVITSFVVTLLQFAFL